MPIGARILSLKRKLCRKSRKTRAKAKRVGMAARRLIVRWSKKLTPCELTFQCVYCTSTAGQRRYRRRRYASSNREIQDPCTETLSPPDAPDRELENYVYFRPSVLLKEKASTEVKDHSASNCIFLKYNAMISPQEPVSSPDVSGENDEKEDSSLQGSLSRDTVSQLDTNPAVEYSSPQDCDIKP
ncbi:hypothetical protein GBAR_LOCUS21905 [Geodia barretti]|uniref:Uncharacterized protein n=1 Tax=Geodia barretti TaxID=519541 RepID=A0AA35T093_GEOBA|nr:hypothetical protein GBAR_LOCUS21905 [Geodia barretti]